MHIVEVTYSWPAETFIVRHALALAETSSIRLTIASKSPARPDSASIQSADFAPVSVVPLPNFDHMTTAQKVLAAARVMWFKAPDGYRKARDKAILQTLARLRPDLVHFHFGSLAVMLARYPQALGIPYSVSLRGSDIQVMPLDNKPYKMALREALSGASGVHAVSYDIARQARETCGLEGDVTVIRTCVPFPEHGLFQMSLSEPLRFVSVGRLHWRKAFPDLVRAMALIPGARLDIVGDGPEREHLLYLIDRFGLQSRVRLLGQLPYAQFEKVLAQATAFVQSSIAEGFSNALAEAMALGKAVFATEAGGTTEVIEDGRNGIIIPTGDPAGMAHKLMLAADAELMNRLGMAARQTAEEIFSMERHAREFYAFYQSCLENL